MSATLIHHGHIRIIKKASIFGDVVVALTTDEEIFQKKGYWPELNYEQRAEILIEIKSVIEVVPSPWLITDEFLKIHNIDILVHGSDNSNQIKEHVIKIFDRTSEISSTEIRKRSSEIYLRKSH